MSRRLNCDAASSFDAAIFVATGRRTVRESCRDGEGRLRAAKRDATGCRTARKSCRGGEGRLRAAKRDATGCRTVRESCRGKKCRLRAAKRDATGRNAVRESCRGKKSRLYSGKQAATGSSQCRKSCRGRRIKVKRPPKVRVSTLLFETATQNRYLNRAKKSLPLSSTRMKAGKSSTRIFQMASMPSSGYSTHSMLLMLFWARMAAGPPIEPR